MCFHGNNPFFTLADPVTHTCRGMLPVDRDARTTRCRRIRHHIRRLYLFPFVHPHRVLSKRKIAQLHSGETAHTKPTRYFRDALCCRSVNFKNYWTWNSRYGNFIASLARTFRVVKDNMETRYADGVNSLIWSCVQWKTWYLCGFWKACICYCMLRGVCVFFSSLFLFIEFGRIKISRAASGTRVCARHMNEITCVYTMTYGWADINWRRDCQFAAARKAGSN